MKRIAIMLLVLSAVITAARIGVYGWDCGLVSVWRGTIPMVWARTIVDGVSGCLMGAGCGLLYCAHRIS